MDMVKRDRTTGIVKDAGRCVDFFLSLEREGITISARLNNDHATEIATSWPSTMYAQAYGTRSRFRKRKIVKAPAVKMQSCSLHHQPSEVEHTVVQACSNSPVFDNHVEMRRSSDSGRLAKPDSKFLKLQLINRNIQYQVWVRDVTESPMNIQARFACV